MQINEQCSIERRRNCQRQTDRVLPVSRTGGYVKEMDFCVYFNDFLIFLHHEKGGMMTHMYTDN